MDEDHNSDAQEELQEIKISEINWIDIFKDVFSIHRSFYHPQLSIRKKIKLFLQSNRFHALVIVFILLDIICVAGEIIISAEKHKHHYIESLEHALKYLGFIILTLFVIELLLKFIFLRKEFLGSKLEIFDAIVILISFGIEVAFLFQELTVAWSLVVLLRLWRLTRIINGNLFRKKFRN